ESSISNATDFAILTTSLMRANIVAPATREVTHCDAIGKPAQNGYQLAMKSRDALPRASGNRFVTHVPLASELVLLDNPALNAPLEEQSARITVCKEQGLKGLAARTRHELNPWHQNRILD
ncbi:hypothetical protein F66182_16020, partial [Fusarium sp. NRRL 66182]